MCPRILTGSAMYLTCIHRRFYSLMSSEYPLSPCVRSAPSGDGVFVIHFSWIIEWNSRTGACRSTSIVKRPATRRQKYCSHWSVFVKSLSMSVMSANSNAIFANWIKLRLVERAMGNFGVPTGSLLGFIYQWMIPLQPGQLQYSCHSEPLASVRISKTYEHWYNSFIAHSLTCTRS